MRTSAFCRIPRAARVVALLAPAVFAGCGGSPDFGGYQRGNSFDTGLSGGYGSYGGGGYGGSGGYGAQARAANASRAQGRGTFGTVQVAFELPDLRGNPFDYAENDVQVQFTGPSGRSTRVPAYFDGGATWRARLTADAPGRYTVSAVTVNRAPADAQKMEPRDAEAAATSEPGFVRRDPRDRTRFARDSGATYLPLGSDAGPGDIPQTLQTIARAGGTWSRVPLSRATGTDLDRGADGPVKPGAISLDSAKRVDEIVQAAEKAGVAIQLVLHHHGQFSTRANSQWADHPWNKANGGWLSAPDEFFANPRAIALTKAKLRYAIARWGYSTALMAWEVFDRVELTDAIYHRHADEVAAWHRDIAEFLRQQDPYHHLITTSASPELADVWAPMDYFQQRIGGPDAVAQIASVSSRSHDRPVIVTTGAVDGSGGGVSARQALWGGLAADIGGATTSGGSVAKDGASDPLQAAAEFLRRSGLSAHRGLVRADATVETAERAALTLRPGGAPLPARQTEWLIPPSGAVEGLAAMPAVLPGVADRQRFRAATFKVSYPAAGTFQVSVGRVSGQGAALAIAVDGTPAATKVFPAAQADAEADAVIEAKVPAGAHTVRVENTGTGWLGLQSFRLAPYAPGLGAIGKAGKTFAVQWLYRRDGSGSEAVVKGKIAIPGLQAGSYRATWWDTESGKPALEETVEVPKGGTLSLATPPVVRDVALFVERGAVPKATPQVAAGRRVKGRPATPAPKGPSPAAAEPAQGPAAQ